MSGVMMDNPHQYVWLHPAEDENGRIVVKDQFGRELAGVIRVEHTRGVDEAERMVIECYAGVEAPRV